mgnify:CR=1 FL=1|jgi:hypothetical protein
MDNLPIFGVPRSFKFAAGPIHFADGDGGDDGGDGSSGDGGSSGGGGSSNDLPNHLDPQRLMAEHGDAQRALGKLSQKAEQLETENKDLREERRTLRDQVPSDEDVVISNERVDELREKGLLDTDNPTAEDVIEALEAEHEKRITLENRQRFNRVVEMTGADRGILEDIGADTLNYELREVEGEDTSEVQVYVQTEEGETEFTQYIEQEYPNLSDAILEGTDTGTSGGDQGSSSSSFVPAQPSGGGGSSNSSSGAPSVDDFVEQENERRGRA